MEYKEFLTKDTCYTDVLKAAEELKISYSAVEEFGLLSAVNRKINENNRIEEELRNIV